MNLVKISLVAAGMAILGTGCAIRATPAAYVSADADVDYEPAYYDDYVVYYDDGGLPYYYSSGRVVYVPQTDVRFRVLTGHYHSHRAQYRSWYSVHGRAHYESRAQWRKAHPSRKPAVRPARRRR